MLRILFAILLILHGLIHLMGFLKAFHLAEISQLQQSISKSAGIFWLLVALLFIAAAVLYLLKINIWWAPALAGLILSQLLIIMQWQDAGYGTIANVVVLLVVIVGIANWNFYRESDKMVSVMMAKVDKQSSILTQEEIGNMPAVVQRWLEQSGVAGKEKAKAVYLEQKGEMRTKPDAKWWPFAASQWFTTKNPGFIWLADVDIAPGFHMSGRDLYKDGRGHMLIKLQSLIPVANVTGPETDQGTLLRYLAEIVWFPSAAVNPYIRWEQLDENRAKATMNYGNASAWGIFTFDNKGFVKSFEAQRYYDRPEGATLETWYIENEDGQTKEFQGRKIPVKSTVTWKLEEGDFNWLKLSIEDISYL